MLVEGTVPRLADITLIAVDCVAHALTRRAVDDTLQRIVPAQAMVWSDLSEAVPPGASWMECEVLRSGEQVASLLWCRVPRYLNTSHFLLVQWDGWVLDGQQWVSEFLEYDYIGAPWWFSDGMNVGNGGFSLRSTRLAQYLASHADEFPVTDPEDHTLCRRYRHALERKGFRWAPKWLAAHFAFERVRPDTPTFGFHGSYHWPRLLGDSAVEERMSLANEYVRSKSPWWSGDLPIASGEPFYK